MDKKEYYQTNRERILTQSKKWAKNNPEKASANYRKKRFLRHNITEDQFNQMILDQNNCCKICSEVFESTTHIHIDHDHNCCPNRRCCGKCIRGLLCRRCNHILGLFHDQKELFSKAIAYLNYQKGTI